MEGGNGFRSMAIESTFSLLSSPANLPEHPPQAPYRHQLGVFFRTRGGGLTCGVLPIRLGHMSSEYVREFPQSSYNPVTGGPGSDFSVNDYMTDFSNNWYNPGNANDWMADGSWSPSIEQSINLGYDDPGLNYNFNDRQRLDAQIYANEHGLPNSPATEYAPSVEITTGDIEVVKEAGGQGGLSNDEFLAQFAGDVSLLEQYVDELETSDMLGVDGAESGTQLNPLKAKLESSRIYGTDIIIVDDNNPNYDPNSSYAMSNADFNRIGTDPSLAAAVGEGKDSGMWNILPNFYQDQNQAISPIPVIPSPLSVITTLLLTPIKGADGIFTTTGVSITSVTVIPLGVSPLTLTIFTALPLSTDC